MSGARTSWLLALLFAYVLVVVSHAQDKPSQPLNWSADDAKRVAALHEHGRRTDGKLGVIWTPPGVLDDAESAQLIARIDKGLAALRSLIGTHPWQVVKDERIVFYVSDDQFVSHANGDETVMIPVARLKDGRAPFLHEASHALTSRGAVITPSRDPETTQRLRTSRPQWLLEGIADYLGQTAARMAGVSEGDVFDTGGLDGVDDTCARRLTTPAGQEIAPLIGALGYDPALFTTDRPKYAPAFYACAFSYTKYLAGLIGTQELIGLMPLQSKVDRSSKPISITADGVLPRIETLTGKPAATVRADWLKSLPVR